MKRWASLLFFFPLLFVSGRVFSEDNYKSQVVGPFGTLNNTDRSYAIPADKASDLLNVDLSPGGKSVKKRKGYSTAFSLAVTTNPTHGNYKFYESGGSDVVLYFYDRALAASISGASPTVLFATGTLNATYQCADSAGFAYCNNTGRTCTIKTNGTTATNIPVTSTGTMIAITPERMVTSGFSEAPNRIDFSKSNDFTVSTPGGNPTDPITFTIVAPGARVTHIVYAHGRVYWFKDTSFGYILEGPTHSDWVSRTVNPSIGSFYNTSIFRDDILYFQAQDGHFYAWDGTSLEKMSRDIQATIAATQGRIANSWIQTLAADFGAGSSTSTIVVDTTTVPGTVRLSTTTSGVNGIQDSISSDRSSSPADPCTGPYYSAQSFTSTNTYLLQNVTLVLKRVGSPGNYDVKLLTDNTFAPDVLISSVAFNPSGLSTSVNTEQALNLPDVSIVSGSRYWIEFVPTGTCSYPGTYVIWQGQAGSFTEKIGYGSTLDTTRKRELITDGVDIVYASGTWQSQIKNAPSLATWDSFQATKANVDGAHSFFIRAAVGVFTVNSGTPAWTAISPGAIPTASTGTYFQIRDVITTTISTTTPILYDFTQNWFEGGASDKPYAIYHDNALWWSVTSGGGATTNNKIIKYDMLNQGYLLYDIAANDMYVRNQSLYFGSPTAGTIFKYGDSDNDNGAAINGYWQSRDFFGDSPFLEKDFWQMSTAAYGTTGTNLTVTYTVNGSSAVAYAVPLTNGSDTFIKRNVFFPFGTTGTTVNLKFSNNSVDSPFEIFGSQIDYTDRRYFPDDN